MWEKQVVGTGNVTTVSVATGGGIRASLAEATVASAHPPAGERLHLAAC